MSLPELKFRKKLLPAIVLGVCATIVVGWIWMGQAYRWTIFRGQLIRGDLDFFSVFTQSYPASNELKGELQRLRETHKLLPQNEVLLNRTILQTSQQLQIPPAILWCLFFQESRLNHLEGIEGDRGARGLGQFSYYSFYEINHNLTRFTEDNLKLLQSVLGRDVRPVEARQSDLQNPSSYYFIPTAVTTSASYLNNRFIQLRQVFDKHGIPYDRDLLWMYAAMAYNKGTRTVLNFLDVARKTYGERRLERLLTEQDTFFRTIETTKLMNDSLKRVWPAIVASEYANELRIHMSNMKGCTLDSTTSSQWKEEK